MLQVARLSRTVLSDSADLVESFIRSQTNPDGGFQNRAGDSDLYYTVFGLEALIALRAEVPVEQISHYLRRFGGGDGLDFVHLACLARCWAGVDRSLTDVQVDGILSRLERFRTPDGGYNQSLDSADGTAYAAYVAVGAYQDFGKDIPNSDCLLQHLESLRAVDGGFSNFLGAPAGLTPATAAVATLRRHFGCDPDEDLGKWLLARASPSGGFFAIPDAPIPDLLSTATALHALSGMRVPLNGVREACLDFVDSLWTNRGGFFGHWSDDAIDTEYTYYALLSLGHLA